MRPADYWPVALVTVRASPSGTAIMSGRLPFTTPILLPEAEPEARRVVTREASVRSRAGK